MPEGHTIHRLARVFEGRFASRVVAASSPQGRFAAGAAVLDGLRMASAEARGKHLFLRFEGVGGLDADEPPVWLRVHLGLYGGWRFAGPGLAGEGGRRPAATGAAPGRTAAPHADPADPDEDAALCVHGNPNVLTRDVGTSALAQGCTGQLTTVEVERFEGNLPPIQAFDPPVPAAATAR